VPGRSGALRVAVTDGPHRGSLDAVSEAILAGDWLVAEQSDRVGIRLASPPGRTAETRHDRSPDSFALTWGAIEVPQGGDPIVVLPDGPTVGGYPVPLVVARADLPLLGQLRPGDRIRFHHVDMGEARARILAGDAALAQASAALAVMRSVW
jgi:antagonist of KipI